MNTQAHLQMDDDVGRLLERRRGESHEMACRRVLATSRSSEPQRSAAALILESPTRSYEGLLAAWDLARGQPGFVPFQKYVLREP